MQCNACCHDDFEDNDSAGLFVVMLHGPVEAHVTHAIHFEFATPIALRDASNKSLFLKVKSLKLVDQKTSLSSCQRDLASQLRRYLRRQLRSHKKQRNHQSIRQLPARTLSTHTRELLERIMNACPVFWKGCMIAVSSPCSGKTNNAASSRASETTDPSASSLQMDQN